MSDGRQFFSYTSKMSNFNGISTTRELGDIPGILKACDVFVKVEREGRVYFELRNKSVPYTRDI